MDGIDARIELFGAHVTGQLRELDVHVTGQLAALEGNLLAAMHQSMRMNTLVTIGVLGTLTTVVSAITSMG
ncbi:MAG: hypothetical protein JJE52_15930 [Acidimicrobiia bacterium]|nr:hypothetical protein [Acidimicrobiia bacterium]